MVKLTADSLPQRAEARLKQTHPQLESMTSEQALAALYELQIQLIEEETRSQELRAQHRDLQQSHDRYEELFQSAPVGYIINDGLGIILEANLAAASMLNIDREQLLGSQIGAYFAPHSRDEFHTNLDNALTTGLKNHFEVEMKRADDSLFEVHVECAALGQAPNRHCRTVLIDLTEHKVAERELERLKTDLEQTLNQTEHELHESEDQLNLIETAVANLKEGVVVTRDHLEWPDPAITFANPAMSDISGFAPEELVGQSLRILQGEQTEQSKLDHIRSELKADRPVVVELKLYRKNGDPYDSELFVGPIYNHKGHRSHFISIHRDISQRKQTEKALRQNQARLEAILNTAVDAIITIDYQGLIESVNSRAESLFGYSRDELLGKNVAMLMPSPYREEHNGYISRYRQTGEARIIGACREQLARHRDGATIPIALSVREVPGLDLFAAFIRDLSEVKALQKEVLDVAAEEDRRIGQELHDNIQQQMVGLEMLATALAESLGERAAEHADAAQLAGEIRLIGEQLHLLSRGLIPLEIDANGLIIALQRLASSSDKGKTLRCRFHNAGDVPLTDNILATHLYRIAQEAVNNAIKHSQASQLNITLQNNRDSIQLFVEDNGAGINESIHDLPGIGLRMMQYRAQLIGANLDISRGQQGGTRVSCTIPLSIVEASNTKVPA